MEQKCLLLTMLVIESLDEWTLSTAFDVSTATFDKGLYTVGQEKRANSIAFNNDGTENVCC